MLIEILVESFPDVGNEFFMVCLSSFMEDFAKRSKCYFFASVPRIWKARHDFLYKDVIL